MYYPHLQEYDKRFNVYYGGGGSGKSHFVVQKMIYKYLKYPNRKCLVVRKIGSTLRESIYALFKSVISDWELYEQVEFRETVLSITFPNGSQFIFKPLDDPEKIKSITNIDDIVIEEATELTQEDFSQLNLRLRSKNPYNQIHLMYNPVSKSNWVYDYWHCRELDPKTTMLLHTTYKDNRFLPDDYIQTLEKMKETDYTYYKIYALGEFATLDKLIFTNWKIDDFDYLQLIRENPNIKALFGIDFGYTNDASALVCVLADEENKKLYIFDEFQQRGMLNNQLADTIINMGYGKEVIIGDSSEPKSIEEIRSYGVPRIRGAKKGNDSILNGIQFLQQFEIIVHSKCVHIAEELQNYTWQKDKNGIYFNKPIDKYNHGIDALRYAVEEIRGESRKIKLLNRALLGL
ncbi:phage terminase large subunit [Natranaerovirga pectinivora]|uniref:Phage terminase large subunit n=1 Tax=Natranaerovirga pectinivora TaxID=682400 RepID=A0A4R3MTK2_9FIRM|nr:PBSX family phage terminase large subunit [Natranaerovirga pectinivora]TCT16394.1 phage terminase large subunit [Natranaerovirga pectinivora]